MQKNSTVYDHVVTIMRITVLQGIMAVIFSGMAVAHNHAQTILDKEVSVKVSETSLDKALAQISSELKIRFVYSPSVASFEDKVSLDVTNEKLRTVLETLLAPRGIAYSLDEAGDYIILKERKETSEVQPESSTQTLKPIPVTGVVKDKNGAPMPGVSVMVKGTSNGVITDSEGRYTLDVSNETEAALVFSFVGYKKVEEQLGGRTTIDLTMEEEATTLGEVTINGGYYTTTDKTKTGSIVKVTAKEIENQPVTSPLLAIQGRVPGVEIAPSSGVPGSAVSIRIRGQNSLRTFETDNFNGNLPLYVVNGVPIDANPPSSGSGSGSINNAGFDPLSNINPSDIESIEILKDGDATGLYGSRGANGVVLITTKTRKANGLNLGVNLYRGVGEITKKIDLLSRDQYLELQHEAIRNDASVIDPNSGITIGEIYDAPYAAYYFPQLLLWDTTRNTDWQDYILGGNTDITDGQLTLSGGNGQTTFGLSGGYHKETLMFPGDFGFKRFNGSLSLSHLSQDEKLSITSSVNYGVNKHKLFSSSSYTGIAAQLSPVAPSLYNDDGTLNWAPYNGFVNTWFNPLSHFKAPQESTSRNLVSSAVIGYKIIKDITLKANLGYSVFNQSDFSKTPISSLNPYDFFGVYGSNTFVTTERSSWIFEPQISYDKVLGKHELNVLAGGTWQQGSSRLTSLKGEGYNSDAFLDLFDSAPTKSSTTRNSEYRYVSAFSRIGYTFDNKYLVNVSFRRDGSSRFGPGKRFGTFSSIGAAWIFSEEEFFKNASFISFAKLRGSYGVTGNDQIGDSGYLKTYGVSFDTYHGSILLNPTAIPNADYAWERTKKFEVALEMKFFKDRISMEIDYYRNRSDNQLVQYRLPATTGFASILSNFPATVENRGLEIQLNSDNISKGDFSWSSGFNISFPRNELIEFKNIESSPYAAIYKVGEPLSIKYGYKWKGVNPTTGLHDFEDLDGDGSITTADQTFIQAELTKYYAGFVNNFAYKGIQLSILFQFNSRTSQGSAGSFGAPGGRSNQPTEVLDRWQKEGDITKIQRATTEYNQIGTAAYRNYVNSDGNFVDVSFWRLKTITLSYTIPGAWLNKVHLQNAKIYFQGQNMLTFTSYKGWDPETLMNVPPMRIMSLGIQLNL